MSSFNFNKEEQQILIEVSRATLKELLFGSTEKLNVEITESISRKCGVFVSLYSQNQLRGCIGNFISDLPLHKNIEKMTIAASTNDYRFNRLEPDEFNNVSIELSILSPLEQIFSLDELELGKHGIYIKKDFRSGTFLPQVAHKTNWTKEEFVAHCSNDKAGLGWTGWKEAELFRYEAFIINENALHK
ncbi:MAG TPA: AmmeMemoRadiSam system protein A [Prolixibacteraceae bacterium]|nr:AmmeMemoRadiSam system protein A [Prolixibacteraceae bacterium]